MTRRKIDRSLYYNKKELKERGWTENKINKWLGEPDAEIPNPFYSTAGAPVKLYRKDRVHEIEAEDYFQEWLQKSWQKRLKLSRSLKEACDRKRQELLGYIKSLKIEIPEYPKHKLYKLAVENYNELWSWRGQFDKLASAKNADEKFLKRISRNFLRHSNEHYEPEINRLFGQIGRYEGYALLRQRIEEEIDRVYPWLKLEDE